MGLMVVLPCRVPVRVKQDYLYRRLSIVETTQVSIDRWMNKHHVAHSYNGILFSLKKE